MILHLETISNILQCVRCPLHKDVTPVHYSTPDEKAPLFGVLGEAPGRIEDRTGVPFTGPSGTFLRMNLRRVGLDPDNGFYFNSVCCWPKRDRTPPEVARDNCQVHLRAQLRLAPKYLLVCGGTALNSLMPRAVLKYAMGQTIPWGSHVLMPVYHPAFIQQYPHMQAGWVQFLDRFVGLVAKDSLDWAYKCCYCTKTPVEWVCGKHRAEWRLDHEQKIGNQPPWQEGLPGI